MESLRVTSQRPPSAQCNNDLDMAAYFAENKALLERNFMQWHSHMVEMAGEIFDAKLVDLGTASQSEDPSRKARFVKLLVQMCREGVLKLPSMGLGPSAVQQVCKLLHDPPNVPMGNLANYVVTKTLDGSHTPTQSNFSSLPLPFTGLDLAGNPIGDAGAFAIAAFLQRPECRLRHIDLSCTGLGPAGFTAVCHALSQRGGNTQSLNLSGSAGHVAMQLGSTGARALRQMLQQNDSLTSLRLCKISFGTAAAGAVADLAGGLRANRTLTTLDMSGCELEPEELSPLVAVFAPIAAPVKSVLAAGSSSGAGGIFTQEVN